MATAFILSGAGNDTLGYLQKRCQTLRHVHLKTHLTTKKGWTGVGNAKIVTIHLVTNSESHLPLILIQANEKQDKIMGVITL